MHFVVLNILLMLLSDCSTEACILFLTLFLLKLCDVENNQKHFYAMFDMQDMYVIDLNKDEI